MIDLIEELSLHPTRADDQLKFFRECLITYRSEFDNAVKQVKMQSNNIENLTRKIIILELWQKQERAKRK